MPAAVSAQNTRAPVPVHSHAFPVPRDLPYPGTIQLEVDATDIARSIFKVREIIPVVQPGRMSLLVPQWLPGPQKRVNPGNRSCRGSMIRLRRFEPR